MALPPPLSAAIQSLTQGVGLKGIAATQARVSAHYRAGGASSGVVMSQDAVLAYALARFPATYAAVTSALAELTNAFSMFSPSSVLDVGCGPGTAGLAALAAFPEAKTLTGIDHNPLFLQFSADLAARSGFAEGRDVSFRRGDMARGLEAEKADVVLSSYTLVELPESAVLPLISRLFGLSGQVLVLVEPGSPAGFARLKSARAALIAEGAIILAPCTHANPCPMPSGDWCHFSVRLPRSRAHRLIKGANVPYEDEKLSYLVAARSGNPAFSSRIIGPVQRSKAGCKLAACGPSGLKEITFSSREPNYKALRKLDWGDGI